MKKHITFLFATLTLLALLLSACGPKATEAPDVAIEVPDVATEAPAEKIKVAVAFPGVVSDQSWNQFGYEGLKRAEAECGVEIAYSEDVFQDEQLETFRNYTAEGYDIIIGQGGLDTNSRRWNEMIENLLLTSLGRWGLLNLAYKLGYFKKSFTALKEDRNNVNQESGSGSRRRKLAD